MIVVPSNKDLDILKNYRHPNCISIYINNKNRETSAIANRIMFKNTISRLENLLLSGGLEQEHVHKLVAPLQILIENHNLTPYQKDSLIIFVSDKFFKLYSLPNKLDIKEEIFIDDKFYIKPLLTEMQNNKEYLVLKLAHKNVALFKGDHYQIHEVRIKNMPRDLKATLNIDEYPKSFETHTISPFSPYKVSKGVHGQYNISEIDKLLTLNFFRRIDKKIYRYLVNNNLPLILAGPTYLSSIYKRVNTYPKIIPRAININLKMVPVSKIKYLAWNIMSNEFKRSETV